MSLLRLLTAGRSLVGIRDVETRYRMTSQRLLPRFGVGKNPFTASESPAAVFVETCRQIEPTRQPSLEAGAVNGGRTAACDTAERSGTVISAGAENLGGVSRRGVAIAIRARTTAFYGSWVGRLFGMFARSRRSPEAEAKPRLSKSPVQGELALNRIKVVRNDLSDADLEVVRSKSLGEPSGVTPNPRVAANVSAGQTAWGRMVAGFRASSKV